MIYNKGIINDINNRLKNNEQVKRDENPYYRGEIGVKKANLLYSFDEDEILEIKKCSDDIFYFIEKYCRITDEDDVIKSIKLRQYQIDCLEVYKNNNFILNLKSRQINSILINALNMLHYLMFKNNKTIYVVTYLTETSVELLDKIKMIYKNLPLFLKSGVNNWNQKSISFDNGCKIKSSTIKNASIGFGIDYLHIDEFAYMPETFYNTLYPSMVAIKDSKMIISSTPNGFNLFYKLCMDARDGKNIFKLIETPYYVIENRDREWVNDVINKQFNGDKELFEQEYNLSFMEKKTTYEKVTNDNILKKIENIEKLLLEIYNKL